jgi:hypothetical protein
VADEVNPQITQIEDQDGHKEAQKAQRKNWQALSYLAVFLWGFALWRECFA